MEKQIESDGAFAWLLTKGKLEELSDSDLETFIRMLQRDALDLEARIAEVGKYSPPLDTVDAKNEDSPELEMLAQALDDLHGQMHDAREILRARGKLPPDSRDTPTAQQILGNE